MPRLKLPKTLLFTACLFSASLGALPALAVEYAITDLGDLGYRLDGAVAPAAESQAYGINIHNQITGEATSPNGDQHAFLYSGGRMIDLGTLNSGNVGLSYGYAINDQGVAVGQSEGPGGDNPFYYTTGVPGAKMVDMGTLGGTEGGRAYGINNSNAIVGDATIKNYGEIPNPFVSSVGGAMQDLGDLNGTNDTGLAGIAYGVNHAGVIVGQSYNPNATSDEIPFIDSGAGMTALPLLSGNSSGNALAINSMGVAVGVSGSQAVAWTGGSVQGLGFLPYTGTGTASSVAFGLNDAGQIVGTSDVAFATPHAFIYENGKMTDLNDLIAPGKSGGFTTLTYARSINNIGSITGYGLRPGHDGYFAFLAVPNIPTVIPPTPGTGSIVAGEDDDAPDLAGASGNLSGSLFSTLGPPAIDKAGDVAFHATIKAPPKTKAVSVAENSGIWLYVSNTGSLIAHTGDADNPAPGTNEALFTKLGDPVLSSSGELAFIGSFAGGVNKVKPSTGIFVRKNNVTTLAYQIGAAAPVFSGAKSATFTSFEELAVKDGGGVAFLAAVTGSDNLGLWSTNSSGTLELVAQKGELLPQGNPPSKLPIPPISALTAFKPIPEIDGQSRSVDTISGNLAFLAQAKSPPNNILTAAVSSGSFSPTNVVSVDGTIPNLTTETLAEIEEPVINTNGSIAFLATLAGTESGKKLTAADDVGIGLITGSFKGLAVQTGSDAPDASGSTAANAVFSRLGNPVLNNDDEYAFIGSLVPGKGDTAKSGTNDSGIWTGIGSSLTRLVRKGDSAPGSNGAFSAFEQLVLPDVYGPIFVASLSGVPAAQGQGLWAVTPSGLSLIVQTGNSLDVGPATKVVKSISIFRVPAGVAGQSRSFDGPSGNLVYVAGFTDGTSAIFEVLAQVEAICQAEAHPSHPQSPLFSLAFSRFAF